jgi:hypothetical protein
MKKLILAGVFCLAPTLGLADTGDTRVLEVWDCTIKEGKTVEEVTAHNANWLAMARSVNAEVNSFGLESMVGETEVFMFVDSYPDLAAWGAVKVAMDSEQGAAIEDGFAEMLDCTSNRLFKSTQH